MGRDIKLTIQPDDKTYTGDTDNPSESLNGEIQLEDKEIYITAVRDATKLDFKFTLDSGNNKTSMTLHTTNIEDQEVNVTIFDNENGRISKTLTLDDMYKTKFKLPTWAWIGIGLGSLVIIGVLIAVVVVFSALSKTT